MRTIGHRGYKAEYPENTLEGFRRVFAAGINAVELDVHLTSDNEVVVVHDGLVTKRLFSNVREPLRVQDLSFEQLSALDCGQHHDEKTGYPRTRLPGASAPLLSSVLEEGDASTLWCVEIKYEKGYPAKGKIVERVMSVLAEHQVLDQTILFSFDTEILKDVRRLHPEQKINFLYEGTNLLGKWGEKLGWNLNIPNWNYCQKVVDELDCDAFSPHYRLLELFPGWRAFFSREMRRCELFVWTCNDKNSWETFLEEGELDGIITDEPVKLRTLVSDLL